MIEMEENMNKYRTSQFHSALINIVISPKYFINNYNYSFHHRQFSRFLVLLNFITLILISKNYYAVITHCPQNKDELLLEYKIDNPFAVYLTQLILLLFSTLTLVC